MNYDHQKIEPKWQKKWEEEKLFEAVENSEKPKFYVLDMFPYPSGAGLHVGHPEGYTATDIISRKARMEGKNVLHPMGWDAFGLPAENYAIKTGVHPDQSTHENIKNFTRQIKALGFSYDWTREIATCDPEYYRWTQWWFLFLYKQDLAYKKEAPVNWCADCQTVLANEQVIDGKCDRCKNEITQKRMSQWYFKITDFQEDQEKDGRVTSGLISGLDQIDWPQSTKTGQKEWIGKSEGVEVDFTVAGLAKKITVFTTRPDTLFGCTYLALAPESQLVQDLKNKITNWPKIEEYIETTIKKSELDRKINKEKTGVKLEGVSAVNPINNEPVPIFIADYVLAGYGTGAIMAVPAHDERDFEFAKHHGIKMINVIYPNSWKEINVSNVYPGFAPQILKGETGKETTERWKKQEFELIKDGKRCFTGDGVAVNSDKFDGLTSEKSKQKITAKLEKEKTGRTKTTYRLRDWLVSRQRYWGAPIPIIYCEKCGEVSVPEKDLPVKLPTDVDFRPMGESPLIQSKEFHAVKCPQCGKDARRESDTMDTFVCSSWYFFAYPAIDAIRKGENPMLAFKKTNAKSQNYLPVGLYIGGAEHTVLHLLYSRFFTKAAHRAGLIDCDEPFQKLRHQGMILGENNEKMSKSRGNVISPDEVVEKYGADTLRLYEMFMGPFADSVPWSTSSVIGIRRFLEKVWRLFEKEIDEVRADGTCKTGMREDVRRIIHQTVKKVTEDIENFRFNTAISQLMIFVNEAGKWEKLPQKTMEKFLKILSPFAPHLAEELWEKLGNKRSIQLESWPEYNLEFIQEDTITLVLQVNGKIRDQVKVVANISKDDALKTARESEKIQKWLDGKEVVKEIFVPGKLVNLVVK